MCYVNPTIALRKMHSQYQSLLVSSLSITWYDIVNWFVQVQKILADFSIANLTTTSEDVDMGEIMLNIYFILLSTFCERKTHCKFKVIGI